MGELRKGLNVFGLNEKTPLNNVQCTNSLSLFNTVHLLLSKERSHSVLVHVCASVCVCVCVCMCVFERTVLETNRTKVRARPVAARPPLVLSAPRINTQTSSSFS